MPRSCGSPSSPTTTTRSWAASRSTWTARPAADRARPRRDRRHRQPRSRPPAVVDDDYGRRSTPRSRSCAWARRCACTATRRRRRTPSAPVHAPAARPRCSASLQRRRRPRPLPVQPAVAAWAVPPRRTGASRRHLPLRLPARPRDRHPWLELLRADRAHRRQDRRHRGLHRLALALLPLRLRRDPERHRRPTTSRPTPTRCEELLDGRRNILFLGRFDPRNGLDTMIHAFTHCVRERGPSCAWSSSATGRCAASTSACRDETRGRRRTWPAASTGSRPNYYIAGRHPLHAVQPGLVRHGAARGDELRPARRRQPHLGFQL